MHPDLIKYLYQKYSDERVAHRENLRETQYLIFDDQLYYLPLQYHLIHEEEEENKLEQLEVVREENNKLFNQLKDMFEHVNVDGILWTYYNPEFIDDTWGDLFNSSVEKINQIDIEIQQQIDKNDKNNGLNSLFETKENTQFEQDLQTAQIERLKSEKLQKQEELRNIVKQNDEIVAAQVLECLESENQSNDDITKTEETAQDTLDTDTQNIASSDQVETKVIQNCENKSDFEFVVPLSLLETIQCSFLYDSIKHLFYFEPYKSIKVLNLRGCINITEDTIKYILNGCTSIVDLDVSFLENMTDEVLDIIADKYAQSLQIFQVRYCKNLTSEGIVKFWQQISGYTRIFEQYEAEGKETKKLQYNFPTESHIIRLNLADNKQFKNEIMKAISRFLFPVLGELCIWGNHYIDDQGFLDMCITRSDNFRRVNYWGWYKISDDSRLWLSQQFSKIIVYNKVDEFGQEFYDN